MIDFIARWLSLETLILNVFLASLIVFRFSTWVNNDGVVYWAVLSICAVLIGPVATVLLFFIQDHTPGTALLILLGHGVAIVFSFAGIYEYFGLCVGGVPTDVDFPTALYFSVVTWTTLGYGDFAPPPSIRLLAGAQAVLGMMYFGLLVGIFANMVHTALTAKRS